MANLTITNTFASGTTISSSQVNQNYTDIKTWLNNRDNASDYWLNMKVLATVSNPAEIKSSAADCELDIDCTGTNGTPRVSWKRSGTTYFTLGVDGADNNKLKIGTTGLTVSNAIIISNSSSAVSIKGSGTNDAATAGYVGEQISANQSTNTNFPSTGTWGDGPAITLTAGDWDITSCVQAIANAATVTQVITGISATSGNSATGLVAGDNQIDLPTPVQSVRAGGGGICSYRVSLSGSTTYYLKVQSAFSVATPQYTARISARRLR